MQKAKGLGLDCINVVSQIPNLQTAQKQRVDLRNLGSEKTIFSDYSDSAVCLNAPNSIVAQREAEIRSLDCGNSESISTTQTTPRNSLAPVSVSLPNLLPPNARLNGWKLNLLL